MKLFGIIVADTGSGMHVSGQHHDDRDDESVQGAEPGAGGIKAEPVKYRS